MVKPAPARNKQFPLWSDHQRSLPTTFVQSALFSVGGKHTRRDFKQQTIASFPGTRVQYTGEELRMDDQDVIMQLFHLARGAALNRDAADAGIKIAFTGHSLLVELGWQTNSAAYNRLKATLERLQASSLKVEHQTDGKKHTFAGSLVRKFAVVESETGRQQRWNVWLEPEIGTFFNLSAINWDERLRLSRDLSRWLHSLLSGEPKDSVFKIAEQLLMELTGSRAVTVRKFRQTLKAALEELVEEKAIAEYKLYKGMLWIAQIPGLSINRAALAADSSDLAAFMDQPALPFEAAIET